jgi:hypothetical protein
MRLCTQLELIAGSRQRSAYDTHDLRTVSVWGDRHLGGGLQLGQQGCQGFVKKGSSAILMKWGDVLVVS